MIAEIRFLKPKTLRPITYLRDNNSRILPLAQ